MATDGRRRSASTRQTRAPALASVAARLATVTDLPSPEREDVTTISRGRSATLTNCRLVRSRRYSSERALVVGAMITGVRADACGSTATVASTGTGTSADTSASVRTLTSSVVRSAAQPSPSTRPRKAPSAMFCRVCGTDGRPGGVAGSIELTSTVGEPSAAVGDRSCTVSARFLATELAIAADVSGSPQVAVIVMIGAAGSVLTATEPRRVRPVPGRPSSSTTGSSTTGERATLAYVATTRSA